MTRNDICAVILAGGQSRRMGFNKALIDVNGRPIISILIDQVRQLTSQIVISSNDDCSYRFLNFPVVPDRFAGCGPLAGLHAAMRWNDCSLYIVLACDLPNLQVRLLRSLVSLAEGFDAAIPRTNDGVAHPLCAVYRRTCLPAIEQALEKGSNKFIETFLDNALAVRWVGPDEGVYEQPDLANINTPADLQKLRRRRAGDPL
jgi:molybdopterin-guanine dinucleotide biosynthesis protein A